MNLIKLNGVENQMTMNKFMLFSAIAWLIVLFLTTSSYNIESDRTSKVLLAVSTQIIFIYFWILYFIILYGSEIK